MSQPAAAPEPTSSLSAEIRSARQVIQRAVREDWPELAAVECENVDHNDLAFRLADLERAATRMFDELTLQGAVRLPRRTDEVLRQLNLASIAASRALRLAGVCGTPFCRCSHCEERRVAPRRTT